MWVSRSRWAQVWTVIKLHCRWVISNVVGQDTPTQSLKHATPLQLSDFPQDWCCFEQHTAIGGILESLFLCALDCNNLDCHVCLVSVLSRSTEEVIALFISIAFVVDAVKGTVKSKLLTHAADVPFLVYVTIFTASRCFFTAALFLPHLLAFRLCRSRVSWSALTNQRHHTCCQIQHPAKRQPPDSGLIFKQPITPRQDTVKSPEESKLALCISVFFFRL